MSDRELDSDKNMANWQLTATTIYCDAVDDEVTILVYKDRSVQCTGYRKYGDSNMLAKKQGKQLKRQAKCEGLECSRVIKYKDKLFVEETKRGAG